MSGELWFDITNFAPDRHEGAVSPENELVYRNINFMIHLTWETPYEVVHGPVRELAQRIRANVTREDWPDAFAAAQGIMPERLEDIAALYSVDLGTTVTDLFIEEARGADEQDPALDRYAIVEHAVSLRTALVEKGLDLCLPFIVVQGDTREGAPGARVDSHQMARHAPSIAGYTMKDLYIRPYRSFSEEARAAIRWCKNNGVFYPPRHMKTAVTAQKHLNNYRCDPATLQCYKQEGYVCIEDEQGHCSAMSN